MMFLRFYRLNVCSSFSYKKLSATQGVPLSEKEIEARNDQEGLEEIKDKLNKLRNQVEKERQDDKKYEGLEGMIQRLITVRNYFYGKAETIGIRKPQRFGCL